MSEEIKKSTTPGPWFVQEDYKFGRKGYIAVKATDDFVVALCGDPKSLNYSQRIANAALIAAAPDMLDVLIAIQETILDPGADADLAEFSKMINDVFAKLANEVGE